MKGKRDDISREIKTLALDVARLSKLLTRDRENLPAAYLKDPGLRTAYMRYFLPANMKKIHLALSDLSLHNEASLAMEKLRVLDVGAGPGTALLGVLAFFARIPQRPSLACVAIDGVAENLRLAEELFNSYRTNNGMEAAITTMRQDIASPVRLAAGPFDLIIFSNVLNELFPLDQDRIARRTEIIAKLLSLNLAERGSCVIIEPALRETSRDLLGVRDLLPAQGLSVFSPCLIGSKCPAGENPRDWCHEDIPWTPPDLIQEIDKLTGLRKDSLKFSYLVVRKDAYSLADRFGKASFRVVSEPLITKGKREFYICGTGGRKLVTRLDKDISPLNADFGKLKRGAIVGFDKLADEGRRYKVHRETGVIIYRQL